MATITKNNELLELLPKIVRKSEIVSMTSKQLWEQTKELNLYTPVLIGKVLTKLGFDKKRKSNNVFFMIEKISQKKKDQIILKKLGKYYSYKTFVFNDKKEVIGQTNGVYGEFLSGITQELMADCRKHGFKFNRFAPHKKEYYLEISPKIKTREEDSDEADELLKKCTVSETEEFTLSKERIRRNREAAQQKRKESEEKDKANYVSKEDQFIRKYLIQVDDNSGNLSLDTLARLLIYFDINVFKSVQELLKNKLNMYNVNRDVLTPGFHEYSKICDQDLEKQKRKDRIREEKDRMRSLRLRQQQLSLESMLEQRN